MTGVGTERICFVPASIWWNACTGLSLSPCIGAMTAFPSNRRCFCSSLNRSQAALHQHGIEQHVGCAVLAPHQRKACPGMDGITPPNRPHEMGKMGERRPDWMACSTSTGRSPTISLVSPNCSRVPYGTSSSVNLYLFIRPNWFCYTRTNVRWL